MTDVDTQNTSIQINNLNKAKTWPKRHLYDRADRGCENSAFTSFITFLSSSNLYGMIPCMCECHLLTLFCLLSTWNIVVHIVFFHHTHTNKYIFFLLAELGDYDPARHTDGYVSEFR